MKIDDLFFKNNHWDFPCGTVDKDPPANAGDPVRFLIQEDSTRQGSCLSPAPHLLEPACLGPALCNQRSCRSEKPAHHNSRGAPVCCNQRKPEQQGRPGSAKHKTNTLNKAVCTCDKSLIKSFAYLSALGLSGVTWDVFLRQVGSCLEEEHGGMEDPCLLRSKMDSQPLVHQGSP